MKRAEAYRARTEGAAQAPAEFSPAKNGGTNAPSPWAAELMERAEAYRARTEGAAQTPAEFSPAQNGRGILESPRIAELMQRAEAYRARTEGAAQTPAEFNLAQSGREILESPRIAELMKRAEAYRARTEGSAQAVSQSSQDSYLPDRPSRSITKADRAVSLGLAPSDAQNGGVPGLPSAKGAGDVLPNVEKVTVDPRKVIEYALNPNNISGGANKARVFESALGYNQSNSNHLIQQIQNKLPKSKAVLGVADKYGQRFTVDIPVIGPNGKTAIVRTGWILEPGSDIPRMTTIFIK